MAGVRLPADDRSWPPLGGKEQQVSQQPQQYSSPDIEQGGGWKEATSSAEAGWHRRKGGHGKGGKGGAKGKRKTGGWTGGWSGGQWGQEAENWAAEDAAEGAWEEHGSWEGGGASYPRRASGGPLASELIGDWLDAQDNKVTVSSGAERRGPLVARLTRRGGREQILSVRRDPASGDWACGNALLDRQASKPSILVWAAFDGRHSVWRRTEVVNAAVEPQDLLPWLLKFPALSVQGQPKGPKATAAARAGAGAGAGAGQEAAKAQKPRRRRNWSSIALDSDTENCFVGQVEKVEKGEEADKQEKRHEGEQAGCETEQDPGRPGEEHGEGQNSKKDVQGTSVASGLPASFEPDNAGADAARVAALLDARQVLGSASNLQEILSYILLDHDLLRAEGEDPMIPAAESPLWERLPDVPKRNVLYRLSSFRSGSYVPGSCIAEFPAGNWSEVHVGRHKFPVAQRDIQALQTRWTGSEEDPAPRATAMARVLSLYRTMENPLLGVEQRSSHQLCGWNPLHKPKGAFEYELFASPFNAIVANGKFASRFPHVEKLFGSAGSYPDILDMWPEDIVVAVNPPFSDAYLDHVFGKNLERIVGCFKKVRLFAPVRDAPWRAQLHRLCGARFVHQFWDATALQERHMEQPVLLWEGSQLAGESA
eukprot:TRINITY_DN1939_c0_g6_i1.p1 TRINITY_DN1939_c0_g6~~TRINITY_DN1939_c0_g6_i1.p1  ORF type:complete len:653 (+),score=123.27 TRINITY_DN1939_c0_g6_i1:133-2091(+)